MKKRTGTHASTQPSLPTAAHCPPHPLETACIHQCFEAQVARTPDALAVVHEQQQVTYAELNQRANALACQLQAEGVGPDVLVGLCVERSIDMAVGILGILKAGGAYVPLDPHYPQERLALILNDATPPVLVTQSRLLAGLPPHQAHVVCLDTLPTPSSPTPVPEPTCVNPTSLAYVIYTSGSTGTPNGVLIEHRSVVNHSTAMIRHCDLHPGDRVLQFFSISFDASAEELFATWLSGAMLVLRNDHMLTSFADFGAFLDQHHITMVDLPTSFWHAWVSELERGTLLLPATLRLVVVGAEKALVERYAAWHRLAGSRVRWLNTYGPTEATIVATLYEPDPDDLPSLLQLESGTVPIGLPIENVEVFVLDESRAPLPPGEPGELYIGGAGLARGYLNRPALMAQRFVPHPFSQEPGARLYKTGDLVRALPDGSIEFLGRVDQQIKIRGFRVEPGEIESRMGQHPTVREVAVAARDDSDGTARLVAYVVPYRSSDDDQPPPTPADLRHFAQDTLPDYMIPAAFVLLDALPRAPSGKIDYRALPDPTPADMGLDLDTDVAAPRTPLEEMITALWGDVLGIEPAQIGRDHTFVALGGHSLQATRIVSRLRDMVQVELPLRHMFDTATVAGLAQHIEALRQTAATAELPPLVPVPRDETTPMPLSFAQQRLWFLDYLEADNLTYTFPVALHLTGPLNVDALRRSLDDIGQRHEILRTTFETRGEQAVQIIAPVAHLPLTITDLRHILPNEREAEAYRLMDEQIQQPFDLGHGPLLRTGLYRTGDDTWYMLITVHDIVADGWSFNVLFRELSAFYQAHTAADRPDRLPDLPALTVHYADIAHWQRQWFQHTLAETQRAYWLQQLADSPDLLRLPTDYPRPPVESNRGDIEHHTLPPDLTDALKAASRREGVTLFMLMLAGFAALMSRYSNQHDILIGSPIANRTRSETEHLIGFFVNTLVFRVDTGAGTAPTVRDLLRHVRNTALDAYAHQDMPFEQLVEALQPERNLSYHPIFQVMFGLDHVQTYVPDFPGVQVEPLPSKRVTAMFDMSVLFEETPDGVKGGWEYATDLFDHTTIQRMQQHYEQLLWGMVRQPDAPLATLPLLTDAERHQMLVAWNDTAADYPRDTTIPQLFEAQAARTPDATALLHGEHGEQQVSFDTLNRRANQLAHELRARGVTSGTIVGIALERTPDLIVGLLGTLKAGAAYLPLDPNYPAGRLSFMLHDSQAALLLTHSHLLRRLPPHTTTTLCLDEIGDTLAGRPDTNPTGGAGPESVAYVVYTSGSTGTPRGVQGLHRASINRFAWMWRTFPFAPGEVCCHKTSLSFVDSVWEIFGPLLQGVPLALIPDDTAKDPLRLLHALHEQRVTRIVLVPSLLSALLESTTTSLQQQLPHLRLWTTSGEALSLDLLHQFKQQAPDAVLLNLYGSSEVAADATCAISTATTTTTVHPQVPIGRPISNTQVYILDPHGQPVPVGVAGELVIGGDGLARGYLNRPELTAERFIPDPFSHTPDARLYKTGDMACFLPDGTIRFLGRTDHQVKLRGFRIELGEIEHHLRQHPAVREALVMAREDRAGDPRLVAYIVPAIGGSSEQSTKPAEPAEPAIEQVQQWAGIFDHYYHQSPASNDDPLLNISSWMSSYTGLPITAAEMREWLNDTIATVTPNNTRPPQRVLEIGCGTGMVLFQLAPHCTHYVGTDPAPTALDYIRQHLPRVGDDMSHVTLLSQPADNFTGIPAGSFDAIILNSVVQYFPSIDYLLLVLEQAIPALAPGGVLLLGDIRNLPLLKAFHTSVQLFQADPSLPREQLQHRVQTHLLNEKELVLDPAFFAALVQRFPALRHVRVLLKRGTHDNEMMRYRYNVLLTREGGDTPPHPAVPPDVLPVWLDWQHQGLTVEALRHRLTETQPPVLGVTGVPNARVLADVLAAELLESAEGPATAGELRDTVADMARSHQVDPLHFWLLGDNLGYHVEISWSPTDGRCIDVLFVQHEQREQHTQHNADAAPLAMPLVVQTKHPRPWHTYANNLLQPGMAGNLATTLRDDLAAHLPDYMVPSAFVLLDSFPLAPGGKVNRRALPAPDTAAPDTTQFVAPRTPLEATLADIWAGVLGLERVGVEDDFFALGGHSLQAMQLVARITTATSRPIFVRDVFLSPTIAALAEVLEQRAPATIEPPSANPIITDSPSPTPAPVAAPTSRPAPAPAAPVVTSEHLTLEHRSLLTLIAAGKLPPIDAASLIYLPPGELPFSFLERAGVTREDVIDDWYDSLPFVEDVLDTSLGRVAVIIVPRFSDELYTDSELVPLIIEAMEVAKQVGARVVSLAGLIPSATDYGRAIVSALGERDDLPPLSTGHATTIATVVLSIGRIVEESGRDLAHEHVGFLGLGSIGRSSLALMLRTLPHPASITLCDVYGKQSELEQVRHEIETVYGYHGPIHLIQSDASGVVPAAFYDCTFVVGATNVPDVLDVARLRPGTLIVDDSAPHCFNPEQAIRRFEESHDILFTEGGVLRPERPISTVRYLPRAAQRVLCSTDMQAFASYNPYGIASCVFSSLLSSRFEHLTPTLGYVDVETGLQHHQAITQVGYSGADLHCEGYHLSDEHRRLFRER